MIRTESLPKLTSTMVEGTIVNWLKEEGEWIDVGEHVYEVETDKTIIEVETAQAGKLVKILVDTGNSVAVGSPLYELEITESKESIEVNDKVEFYSDKKSKEYDKVDMITSKTIENESNNQVNENKLLLRVSPSARRIAKELGVDLQKINGTGPKGRIRNRDVKSFFDNTPSSNQIEVDISNKSKVHIASNMRKAIAKELLVSTHSIPSFWIEKWVNAEALLKWKTLLKSSRDKSVQSLTITDFIMQAIGLGLVDKPAINIRWIMDNDQAYIEEIGHSHVGLAISVDDGVIAPVLSNIGELSLGQIAKARQEVIDFVVNSRNVQTKQTASITLTNLGATGIDRFRAIMKPAESMIVSVGAIQEKVIVKEGQPVVAKGFTMVLSADHRVIDGVIAAEFLSHVASIIEQGNWKLS